MDAEKLQIKLYANPRRGARLQPERFVTVFHDWIRRGLLPELMIDVAAYDHVPRGPSVLFVGHASDYTLDEGKGRPGLLYSRKRAAPPPAERLGDTLRRALHVASLLEKDASLDVQFSTAALLLRINDRLGAPNTDATLTALRPELEAFFGRLYDGAAFSLTRASDPRELFSVELALTDPNRAPSIETLLSRVGGPL